jgi:hypothetical protein
LLQELSSECIYVGLITVLSTAYCDNHHDDILPLHAVDNAVLLTNCADTAASGQLGD